MRLKLLIARIIRQAPAETAERFEKEDSKQKIRKGRFETENSKKACGLLN